MIFISMKNIVLILLLVASTHVSAQHILSSRELFAPDKLLHLGAGYAIGSSVTAIADAAGSKNPYIWGIAASIIAAAGKEYYDRRTGGTVEIWDGYMTAVGGSIGVAIISIPISKRTPKNTEKLKRHKENFINNDPFY
jgi:hypothetical protein